MAVTLLALEGCGEAHVSECLLETELWGEKVKDGNGEAHVREEDPEGQRLAQEQVLSMCTVETRTRVSGLPAPLPLVSCSLSCSQS